MTFATRPLLARVEALYAGLSPRETEHLQVAERVALGLTDGNGPDDWAPLLARLALRRSELLAERGAS